MRSAGMGTDSEPRVTLYSSSSQDMISGPSSIVRAATVRQRARRVSPPSSRRLPHRPTLQEALRPPRGAPLVALRLRPPGPAPPAPLQPQRCSLLPPQILGRLVDMRVVLRVQGGQMARVTLRQNRHGARPRPPLFPPTPGRRPRQRRGIRKMRRSRGIEKRGGVTGGRGHRPHFAHVVVSAVREEGRGRGRAVGGGV